MVNELQQHATNLNKGAPPAIIPVPGRQRPQAERLRVSGIHTSRYPHVTVHEAQVAADRLYLTASVSDEEAAAGTAAGEAYEWIAGVLRDRGVAVIHERVYGSLDARPDILAARARALGAAGIDPGGALTYVQGRPLWGRGLAGVQVYAVRVPDAAVWTVHEDGLACGRAYQSNGTKVLFLQDIHGAVGDAKDRGRPEQAERMFQRAQAVLASQGAQYCDVVRTWIYIADVLDWYDDFNAVRNAAYSRLGLMPRPSDSGLRLPASTGIEGANPHGAGCTMDLIAMVRGNGGGPAVRQLHNVKQQDAFQYGSAFSRGAAIAYGDVKHIEISGTAAVDEQGNSMYPGDPRRQILRTFESVQSLIGQEGAALADICQATVFIKRPEDYDVFLEVAGELGLSGLPGVFVNADVCRDAWLFEMDGVACVPSRR
jgi:enamine deaminase RidA (YjgF/YER057c/UK114 family)